MTLSDLRKSVERQFRDANFDSPDIEADILCEEVAHVSRSELYLGGDRELTLDEQQCAADYLKRRMNHEPYQYICNTAYFRELKLYVAPGCLIPRPETEYLLDSVLKQLPQHALVCELGTGSGAIALSIAYERPDCVVHASEVSPAALAIARRNAASYNLNNVSFFEGSLLDPLPNVKYQALVANLPYIPYAEREKLPRNVRDYEPELALFADDSGMALIKTALQTAPMHMVAGGLLFFEMGEMQGDALTDFAVATGCYSEVSVREDQYGVKRFLLCRLNA